MQLLSEVSRGAVLLRSGPGQRARQEYTEGDCRGRGGEKQIEVYVLPFTPLVAIMPMYHA